MNILDATAKSNLSGAFQVRPLICLNLWRYTRSLRIQRHVSATPPMRSLILDNHSGAVFTSFASPNKETSASDFTTQASYQQCDYPASASRLALVGDDCGTVCFVLHEPDAGSPHPDPAFETKRARPSCRTQLSCKRSESGLDARLRHFLHFTCEQKRQSKGGQQADGVHTVVQ